MRAIRSLLLALVAIIGVTATAHAETFGVEKPRTGDLYVAVDHYVGFTGHSDDGSAPLALSDNGGRLGALQSVASDGDATSPTAGEITIGLAAFAGVLLVQHALGADPDATMVLAEGVTLAKLGESVDKIAGSLETFQKDTAERHDTLKAEVEKGQRSQAELKAEMDKRVEDMLATIDGVVKANKETTQTLATALQDLDRPGVAGEIGDAKAAKQAKDDLAMFMRADSIRDLPEEVAARLQDAAPQGAMSTDDLRKGGIVVPEVIRGNIISRGDEFTPLRQHAHVYTISEGDALVLPRRGKRAGAQWSGERKAASNTQQPTLEGVRIPVNKLDAEPPVTVEMLQDPSLDVVEYLEDELSIEFSIAEGDGFVNGDGVEKPLGFLSEKTAAVISTFLSGNANTIPDWKVLAKLQVALPSIYASQRAKWYFNRASLFTFLTFTDDQNAPIWNFKVLAEGKLPQFLGHEYVTLDAMPALNLATNQYTTGDIPVAFGDMYEAYAVVDKVGMMIRPNPYKDNAFVFYYVMKRVGGQTVQPDALRLLKIGS